MANQGTSGFTEETLCDRYQVQQQLGKKAGRPTLLARDLQTEELVVIKLVLFDSNFDWNELKLFEREAETLKALSHPAIPRYLDYFEVDLSNGKGFALVESYIEAKSLDEQLKAGRSFSEVEVKQLAKAILEIIAYLHERQPPVIHRDIKPSNILLTNRSGNSVGQVYLVDFGSVQTLATRRGSTMTVVGTYGYMPPEQLSGKAYPASDLYSLGATLIYLVTGQHPADLPQTDLRIEFEQAASINPDFINWLKWMTEPILSNRLASAREAMEALNQTRNATHRRTTSTHSSVRKPPDSRVVLAKNANLLQILIPPAEFSSHLTSSGVFYLIIMPVTFLVFFSIALTSEYFFLSNWLIFIAIVLPLIGLGIYSIWKMLLAWFGKMEFYINQQQISLKYELFGFQRYHTPTSSRQSISHIELAKDIYNRPYLIIWAGTKKYELSINPTFPLTTPEVEWLARELSDWLSLPITKG